VVYLALMNNCGAGAVLGKQETAIATASDVRTAETLALKRNPGSHIGMSGCARNYQGPDNHSGGLSPDG
jgi:hypothetical protein